MRRVVLGISGASGAAIGLEIGRLLAAMDDVELHLVVTSAARRTIAHEAGDEALGRLIALADHFHPEGDIGASIASGSFRTAGMIVAPCSMRSLAAIATGMTDNLLIRAADVQLKERRRLVLLARETPLHLGHLRNMVTVTEMGAMVMPPVPAFYRNPATVEDIVAHIAARAVDLLGLTDTLSIPEWRG
ncbi:UbiX family flavin prenyltransferase [Rhizobium sp. AG855]|uniref:UbiX family flavin prenyltransferase n=1 Tax=Rhizobium sp. AG855 TaxID=2183898 RepID=UPI000E71CA1F|nr:UbiX family flavin prenyltransferase [Rhizobium sp. AG855]RKE83295.1 4-hydroxy-3-polyprenylbenzoate decarboxylase [Rhizobium sp. AG855]